MKEIIIKISMPEKEWEQYGDLSVSVEHDGKGTRGGVYTEEDFFKDLKRDFCRLEKGEETCSECGKSK